MITFFKQLIRVLTAGSFRLKKDAENLTEEQFRAISIGAVLNEQGTFYINSLETGADKMIETKKFKEWWDVFDSASAISSLDFLRNGGHRIYYNSLLKIVLSSEPNEWENKINEGDFEDPEKALHFLFNIHKSISDLRNDGVIKEPQDLQIDITSWDLGRLSSLARSFYSLGYINEAAAWENLMFSLKESQKIYNSWEDFAKGYLIGRAMWSGNNDIFYSVDKLLNNQKSPWKKVSFK